MELRRVAIREGFEQSEHFSGIKDLIVEWMRIDTQSRADELKRLRASMPETVFEQRKKGVLATLKGMLPGGVRDIAAMVRQDGKIVTEASDIADVLNTYWQKVFSYKETDKELKSKWLESVMGKFRVTKTKLRPSRDVVRKVIQTSRSSAPGPDAIPFEVYRAVGEDAVELFWDIANRMLDGTATPDDDFNLALMVCLPKAVDGTLDDNSPYFSAGGTRPLSIVDAANRILASIFCEVLEHQIGQRIERA